MKKLTYIAIATAALLFSTASAQAGPFEGAFFGLQLGDTFTTEKVSDNLFFQNTNPAPPSDFNINPTGYSAGILGGYRWKFDKFIIGLEASGTWSNARKTLEYNDGAANIYDTQFIRNGTLAIGPKFGYLLMDNLMGFVGADYMLGQFKSRELDNGTTTCPAGDCPNSSFIRQGVGLGGGLEMAVNDKFSVRLDYEHTLWQSKRFTDSAGDTAKVAPDDNSVRAAVIYAFK